MDYTDENNAIIDNVIQTYTVKKKNEMNLWRRSNSKRRVGIYTKIVLQVSDLRQRVKPPKRASKEFLGLEQRQKCRRLASLNEVLDEFCSSKNIQINNLLGYILYQRNYNSDKQLARLGEELFETSNIEVRSALGLDQTVTVKHSLDLNKHNMDSLKALLKDYIAISNRNLISEYSKEHLPSIERCRSERGMLMKSREEATMLTVKRLVKFLKEKGETVPKLLLSYKEKTGHDGAGSTSVYKSVINPMQDQNIFSKMFVALELTDTASKIPLWTNPTPNSSHWTRPHALMAEKESNELLKFVNETFEPQEKALRDNEFEFSLDNENYYVQVGIQVLTKGLNVRMLGSRLGGAECLLCVTRQAEWNDVNKIKDYNYLILPELLLTQ